MIHDQEYLSKSMKCELKVLIIRLVWMLNNAFSLVGQTPIGPIMNSQHTFLM